MTTAILAAPLYHMATILRCGAQQLAVSAAGCAQPRTLAWSFDENGITSAAIYATIIRGDCEGDDVVYRSAYRRDERAKAPAVLPAGGYCLNLIGADDDCMQIANASLPLTLPRDNDVSMRLEPTSQMTSLCKAQEEICDRGLCVAGAADAGADTFNDVTDSAAADTMPDVVADSGDTGPQPKPGFFMSGRSENCTEACEGRGLTCTGMGIIFNDCAQGQNVPPCTSLSASWHLDSETCTATEAPPSCGYQRPGHAHCCNCT